jgi:hypothetical protein
MLSTSTAAGEAALGTLKAGDDNLSLAGAAGASWRQPARRRFPDAAGDTPEQGRRVPAATVTAISAIVSPLGE